MPSGMSPVSRSPNTWIIKIHVKNHEKRLLAKTAMTLKKTRQNLEGWSTFFDAGGIAVLGTSTSAPTIPKPHWKTVIQAVSVMRE